MKKRDPKKKPSRAKRILRLPDLDHSKIAVLSTLSSPDSQRSYRFAIDDFISWYCSEPRLAFNKTVVLRYRLQLEDWHTKPRIPACWAPSWRLESAASGAQKDSECDLAIGSAPKRLKHC